MHCLLRTHSSPLERAPSCTDISSFLKLSPTNPHQSNAISYIYIWNPNLTAQLKQLVMAVDTRLRSMLHYEEQKTKRNKFAIQHTLHLLSFLIVPDFVNSIDSTKSVQP